MKLRQRLFRLLFPDYHHEWEISSMFMEFFEDTATQRDFEHLLCRRALREGPEATKQWLKRQEVKGPEIIYQSDEEKEIIEKAASLEDTSPAAFLRSSALEVARKYVRSMGEDQ